MNDGQRFRYLMKKTLGKRLTYAELTEDETPTVQPEVF